MTEPLYHGDGRTLTTILLIGKPANSSYHYIVEILPTSNDFPSSNPLIQIPIPDDQNTNEPNTMSLSLRRITKKVKVEGYIFYTAAGYSEFGTDNSYIETASVTIFNTTTGAITVPTGADFTNTNITSCIKKKWMLEQIRDAGASGTTTKTAHTLQWRSIRDPAGSNEMKNIYHQKVFITNLTISDQEIGGPVLLVNNVQEVKALKVSMELSWGDPNA